MSGMFLVLDIAKTALSTQQYGIEITGHNIANVNNPSYSRQSPVIEAKDAELYDGVLLGRGVETTNVVRATDQFIESQLSEQKSKEVAFEEMEQYMRIVEGFLNENSETSLSVLLSDFWNLWHDISNNPAGSAERIAIWEHSALLAERFNSLEADLIQMKADLTGAVNFGVGRINEITEEIADLNTQIVAIEASTTANDLRDKRTALVSELSEYIDVKSFEQSNGSLTIITARGCVLVQGNEAYDLEMGGTNGDRVTWRSSGDAIVDITDYLANGKRSG